VHARETPTFWIGKTSASASPDALLSADASLATVLAGLEGLEVEGLRRQWRNHLGGEAPAHLPRWLLVKVLGHRLQIAAFGDLDKPVRRLLRDEADGEGVKTRHHSIDAMPKTVMESH
jgi:Protein of unknown function (DUF2924)